MSDQPALQTVAAAAAGVIVGSGARLFPEDVDVLFLPAMWALGWGVGKGFVLLFDADPVYVPRRAAAITFVIGAGYYIYALIAG